MNSADCMGHFSSRVGTTGNVDLDSHSHYLSSRKWDLLTRYSIPLNKLAEQTDSMICCGLCKILFFPNDPFIYRQEWTQKPWKGQSLLIMMESWSRLNPDLERHLRPGFIKCSLAGTECLRYKCTGGKTYFGSRLPRLQNVICLAASLGA